MIKLSVSWDSWSGASQASGPVGDEAPDTVRASAIRANATKGTESESTHRSLCPRRPRDVGVGSQRAAPLIKQAVNRLKQHPSSSPSSLDVSIFRGYPTAGF